MILLFNESFMTAIFSSYICVYVINQMAIDYREYFLYLFKVIYLKSHLPYRQSSNIVDPESKMFLMTDDSFLQKQGSFGYSVPH